MDEERAFDILDLPKNASSAEIEKQFRDLIHQNHPDSGGDREELIELIEARETAIESSPGTEMTKYDKGSVPELPNKTFDQKKQESEKTVNRVIRKQTSRFRRYKQFMKIFGSIIGLTTFLRVILETFNPRPSPEYGFVLYFIQEIPISTWFLLLVIIGMAYWFLNMKINNIDIIVSEVEEVFDQKSNLLQMFSELDIDLGDEYVTEGELQSAFNEWVIQEKELGGLDWIVYFIRDMFSLMAPKLELHSIARKLGPADFNRIFLRKCIEADILEEEVESSGDNQFEVNYQINI